MNGIKIFAAVCLLAFVATGCANMSVADRVFTACSTYGSAIRLVTPHKPKLPATMLATVDETNTVARSVCNDNQVSDDNLTKLERGISGLLSIAREYE